MSKADRDLRKLKKPVREARRVMEKECHKQWLYVFVTEGKRSWERQKELYAQWRTKPWKVVTWTLHSRHLIWDAFDIAFDPKHHGTLYPNDNKLRNKVGSIWEKAGLERWWRRKTPDKPHFQWSTSNHKYTPKQEEDIYRKLFNHFVELLEDADIDKEKIKDIPEEIREQAKKLDIKEVVVDYLEELERGDLFEEFMYMMVNLWKGK